MNHTASSIAAGACLVLAGAAGAQDLVHKAPPQSRPVVIEHATIHTGTGDVIENGTIVFDDGVITQVVGAGQRVRTPRNAEVIDATGKHVFPGFVSAVTSLGLVEVNAVRATVDSSEVGAVTPEVRGAVAVNPDSTLIPVARTGGVLTAGVFPSGGAIPGRASVMRLDGWTWEDMTIDDAAGLIINWPRVRPFNSPFVRQSAEEQRKRSREQIERITTMVDAARAYYAAKDADPTIETDLRFEAMRDAIRGDDPVFLFAQEYEQIVSGISWALDKGLRPILVGGADALLAADLLKSNDIPVILTGTHRLPGRRDAPVEETYTLPIELDAAGVQWCLSTGGGSFGAANERNLPLHAAACVAYGMTPERALRAITLDAARMLGVGDRLGSIERGKAATLVIADAAPLDYTMRAEAAFIDGRRIDLTNKQTELRDKYRDKYRQLGLIDDDH
ncbi:MAG: imidazolonepropionase [Planctomycetota bacterium]|nr:MAG: imidazolonepropionase [Planctomycetota bacterium]